MADLAARADVDPVVLREDAARAKEMVAILQAAKKAEDRREKLMAHASTRRERRTLESRGYGVPVFWWGATVSLTACRVGSASRSSGGSTSSGSRI